MVYLWTCVESGHNGDAITGETRPSLDVVLMPFARSMMFGCRQQLDSRSH